MHFRARHENGGARTRPPFLASNEEQLQKAIKDVNEDSPLAAELLSLSKSATRLHDSVDKGATSEDAMKEAGRLVEAVRDTHLDVLLDDDGLRTHGLSTDSDPGKAALDTPESLAA